MPAPVGAIVEINPYDYYGAIQPQPGDWLRTVGQNAGTTYEIVRIRQVGDVRCDERGQFRRYDVTARKLGKGVRRSDLTDDAGAGIRLYSLKWTARKARRPR